MKLGLQYTSFTRSADIKADAPRKPGSSFEKTSTEQLASQILLAIFELSNRAAANEINAARLLCGMARHSTIELRALVDEHPSLLADMMQKSPQWPMLVSLHPENEQANKAFLKKHRIGESADVNAHSGARWNRDNPATRWAMDVIETIRSNQQKFPLLAKPYPNWVKKCAALPALSKDSAAEWWAVGKLALLEQYPEPQKLSELAKLAKAETCESRKKHRILEQIGRALHSIAAK